MSDAVSISIATAAPIEIEIDGKMYVVSKITLRDLGRIEQWMRDALVASGRENIKDPELTNDEKQLVLREAYVAAAQCSLGSDYANNMLKSIDGLLRLAWLSLRKENVIVENKKSRPMTLDDTADILTSIDAINEIVEKAAATSGFDFETGEANAEEAEGEKDSPENPTSEAPTPERSSAPSQKPTDGRPT